MSRKKHIDWLCTQGTSNVEAQTLEKLAGESDILYDAVCLIIWRIFAEDDDAYELVEGTNFPLRIRFDKEGLFVLAPYIHADKRWTPQVVRGNLKWERMTGLELEQLVHLALGLQKQRHTLAEAHLDEAIAAQARLTSYSVRFRVEKTRKKEIAGEATKVMTRVMTRVIWDNDVPGGEQHIRDEYGDRLVSLELLGPMECL
jgi:hypothetical protein